MEITPGTITFSIAVLGAVLGLLNFYRAVARDKVHVKITPSLYVMAPPGRSPIQGMSVEVINLGFVPVTVSNAYIQLRNNSIVADMGITTSLGKWEIPVRLEARESTTLFFSAEFNHEESLVNAKCVLVKTACGINLRSSNRVFRDWIDSRKKKAEQAADGNPH